MKPVTILASVAAVALVGCSSGNPPRTVAASSLSKTQKLIVAGARDQLTWGTRYDPSYIKIAYPGGDPPRSQGVCTDVVVRAYRNAGIDLQKLIHEDMQKAWGEYPRYKGRTSPDSNIDHRRVPNQKVFLKRHGASLTINATNPKDWQPGDIVEWKLANGLDHTGLLTDKLNSSRFPLVIHNIGAGPQEEDVLQSWKIVGHFRYPGR